VTDAPIDEDILRRSFVAIATSTYEDAKLANLDGKDSHPGVADEVATLAGWLCDERLGKRAFAHTHPDLAANPTKNQIRGVLEDPAPEQKWRAADAAVLFVTGHGLKADGAHWLAVQATDTAKPKSTALRTADLIGWLTETGIEHLLLVLDSCHAGAAAGEAIAFDDPIPATWLVLPAATKNETAKTGALTGAVRELLEEIGEPDGRNYGEDPYLRVDWFLEDLESKLGRRVIPLQGSQQSGVHVCLPNPHHQPRPTTKTAPSRRDLALPKADVEAHWGPRSRGVANADDAGWLFTGRADLMRRLIAAATSPTPGVLLVTGGAGSGKSAVLARLVTLSDPDFRAAYAPEVARIPDDLTPREGAVDVAVLATGKNATEILAQICRATGALPSNGSTPALPESQQAWTDWITDRRGPVTIVVDALDEATNPTEVLTGCLQHLRLGTAASKVRLLVGVRSTGDPGESGGDAAAGNGVGTAGTSGTPRRPVERQLADVVQDGLAVDPDRDRVQVDADPWWMPGDVSEYVTSLLLAPDASPYRWDDAATKEVAEYLSGAVRRSFLVARLAAEQLARRTDVVDANDPAWRATIADGVLGVFRTDLHQRLRTPQERLKAVHLLRAVAFAYGRGLPWRTIWPLVANAVADDPNYPDEATTYGDSDIAWLLNDTGLAGYLVTDREDDITVYRLFHDNLRTTLRERWRELLDSKPT
jgi:hypothetical protein